MLRAAFILSALTLLTSSAFGQSKPPSRPLVVNVTLSNVIATTYIAPPVDGSRLVFVGERITVVIDLRNQGVEATALRSVDGVGTASGPSLRLIGRGGNISSDIPLNSGVRRVARGFESADAWRWDSPVAPGEAVRWTAELDLSDMPPGVYELMASLPVTDQHGNRVRGQSEVQQVIDVRPTTSVPAEELAMRTALRLYSDEDYVGSTVAVQDLLRTYPNSLPGYTLLGHGLARVGRAEEAVKAYRTALAILNSGSDVLYMRVWGEQTHLLEHYRATLLTSISPPAQPR